MPRCIRCSSAFIAEQAAQCGYCASGILMAAKALLDGNKDPSDAEIRKALEGNLCRCGTHSRILRAIKRAAKELRGEGNNHGTGKHRSPRAQAAGQP